MKPVTLTENEWREILAATALATFSYTEAINNRIDQYRVEIDADDAIALSNNSKDMIASMKKIGPKGKIIPGTDTAYQVMAIMLDSVEAYHAINTKHFEHCACENCERLEKEYRLVKKMVSILAGATITNL